MVLGGVGEADEQPQPRTLPPQHLDGDGDNPADWGFVLAQGDPHEFCDLSVLDSIRLVEIR